MFIYEPERTKNIVERLVKLCNKLRSLVVGYFVVAFAVLLAVLDLFLAWPDGWWVGAILGALLGYGAGVFVAAIPITVLEGLAQLLVAQDRLLSRENTD